MRAGGRIGDMKDKARRILIVDPDPRFAGKANSLLSADGYDVEVVGGVTGGARRLKDVRFDCVIVDEDLPEMKGHDAVAVLKAICPDVPIIMTAVRNTLELESSIRRQDVFFYYVKNFDMHELQMAVHDAFRKIGKDAAPRSPDRPARILVVDDDRDFVAAVRSLLEGNSYEVAAAYNKDEAMAMVQSARPDLILLDIMMEGFTDGFAVCRKLKYDRRLKDIPVIVVSSISTRMGLRVPARSDLDDFPADDFVEKPVASAELLERVAKLLN
jgi:CheY-like chemotaxis protein